MEEAGRDLWLVGCSGMLDRMAYDETLAQRLRERLAGIPSLREVRMFGGLSFMVDGHIVAFASRSGDMMVCCPPEDEARLLAEAPLILTCHPLKTVPAGAAQSGS